ncbi:phosphatidylglycerol lysyltransferase domain-containing protein [Chlorobium sp. N1]|uniref:phosphatidylglycerol lysyltransferase domain-containing protein n=1 Tax=Chlorobium sp. N1 TaxID=2491138 RepID=UPI00103EF728|nr:phosphatidylglycerol lysyltransferase domain-containing protein [Chlorobium sp. N1]TCD48500.1 DUF2156 domain-containing protein [Chlorobium sp. N1]
MHTELPSSWRWVDDAAPRYHEVQLPLSRLAWLPFADIPRSYDLFSLYADLNDAYPEGFVIRGCPPGMSDLFLSLEHETFRTGIDALIDLTDRSHFEGKKVLASLKRGWRHGRVEEVPIENVCAKRFGALWSSTPHAGTPRLRNVYRSDPAHASRCFIFRSCSGEWLACMTLSRRGKNAYHTELMLRSTDAPGDIMECLIAETAEQLRSEGVGELSLGEVPFLLHEEDLQPMSLLERVLVVAAPLCRHAYDYEGLYAFKNKFRPRWRTMRLCAGPGVSFTPSLLVELAYAMGFIELFTHSTAQLLESMKDENETSS